MMKVKMEYTPVDFPTQEIIEVKYCYLEMYEDRLRNRANFYTEECEEVGMPLQPFHRYWDYTVYRMAILGVDLAYSKLYQKWKVSILIQGSEEWNFFFDDIKNAKKFHAPLYDYVFPKPKTFWQLLFK
jgi:hypothetical protein